jgi:DNA-binding CsgD family transcriptional regulator
MKDKKEKLELENARLERELAQMTARYETLLMAFERVGGGGLPSGKQVPVADAAVWQVLLGLTPRQHVALQMMLGAASNAEIAKRLGITESTAKVHVRALFTKLGVRTRSEFLVKVKPVWDRIPPDEYERASGLPKAWHDTWRPSDPWRKVYWRA